MLSKTFSSLPVSLIALLASSVSGTLPYIPTTAFLSQDSNSHAVYIFSPTSNSSQLLSLDTSSSFDSSAPPVSTLSPSLPFLGNNSNQAFTPVIDSVGDLTVYVGNCSDGAEGSQLWRFARDEHSHTGNGTWSKQLLSAGTTATNQSILGSNYLASGISFSPILSTDTSASALYVFGGMCPTSKGSADDWASLATYSNMMLTLNPVPSSLAATPGSVPYELGVLTSQGPPIAEAGFSITALLPTFSNSSTDRSQQQNFVLVGGHTREAFINMSQVALFSLPEQSWSFLPVDQSSSGRTDLAARDTTEVEPRSGHTAILTADGDRIVVFGGWVGDINTPADPQLAVLHAGEGYGGSGDWIWTIPPQEGPGLSRGAGIYGHGAVMLPGDIMMIYGGYDISSSPSKRSTDSTSNTNSKIYLFNTTSNTWITSYSNTAKSGSSPDSGSGPLKTPSQKAGLGLGIALGCSAVAAVALVYFLYSRRLRRRRDARDKELRELALGAQRYHSNAYEDGGVDGRGGINPTQQIVHKRSNSAQDAYPWAPISANTTGGFGEGSGWKDNGGTEAERTGLLVEIPSPTRGLRRSLHTRATYVPAPNNQRIHGPGSIHPIDERDEYEDSVPAAGAGPSSRRPEMTQRPYSDPFLDPIPLASNPAVTGPTLSPARERELEVQGWVDDWQAAEAIMAGGPPLSRRSGSPDKSDRTSSTLSEQSTRSAISANSIQHSLGTVSRSLSHRTADLLFGSSSNASASNTEPPDALSTATTRKVSPERQPAPSTITPHRRSQSLTLSTTTHPTPSNDLFTTAPTLPSRLTESESLLGAGPIWSTPPESPTKTPTRHRANSFSTSTAGPSTLTSFFGTVRRALTSTLAAGPLTATGPSSLSPTRDNARSANSSPTKRHPTGPYPPSSLPRRAASAGAAIWRRKQGPTDWDAERASPSPTRTTDLDPYRDDAAGVREGDDEWDVEAAVERRLVQVMFTVPREKLRVVNGDADAEERSVSDAGHVGGEGEDEAGEGKGKGKGKGKGVGR